MGADIEMQSTRVYPFQTTAAHVLGYVQRSLDSVEGEEAYFSYRLPGFRGQLGIEAGYDEQLRGKAGAKSVLVNSVGAVHRQVEVIATQLHERNAVRLCKRRGGMRRRHTADVETVTHARGQMLNEPSRGRAGSQAAGHAVFDERHGRVCGRAFGYLRVHGPYCWCFRRRGGGAAR